MADVPFNSQMLQKIAELKIQQAMDAGGFDNLPGFGKPFEFDEMSYDPNWWIKAKLKRENLQSTLTKDFFRELNR